MKDLFDLVQGEIKPIITNVKPDGFTFSFYVGCQSAAGTPGWVAGPTTTNIELPYPVLLKNIAMVGTAVVGGLVSVIAPNNLFLSMTEALLTQQTSNFDDLDQWADYSNPAGFVAGFEYGLRFVANDNYKDLSPLGAIFHHPYIEVYSSQAIAAGDQQIVYVTMRLEKLKQ